MGWSCASAAGNTMSRIQSHHQDGTYKHNGERFFFEPSRREHKDGAITGMVWMCIGKDNPDGTGFAKKIGGFRIDPDGKVSRGPKHFKVLALSVPEGRCEHCGDRVEGNGKSCWACNARRAIRNGNPISFTAI